MRRRVGQLAGAVVAALVLMLLTTGATGEHPSEEVTAVLRGQPVRMNLPPTSEPKGVAIYFHGQGGGASVKMDGPWLDALRRAGWVVASSQFHYANWGNEDSTEDTRSLIAWAERQGGAPVRLFIGASMGGTTSLNAMLHGIDPPPCWYGIKPALDLGTMGRVPQAPELIRAAYGGRPYPSSRNPVDNVARLPLDVRYRFVASPDDPFVPFDANSGVLVESLEQRGADVTLRVVQGEHQDASHYSANDLVGFAESCARPTASAAR